MCNRLVFACLVLVVLRGPDQLYAQFTDPRTYSNTPVGLNQLKLIEAYRSVAVSARICKLGIQLIGTAKNDKNEAGENQSIAHGSNLADRMITRIPSW